MDSDILSHYKDFYANYSSEWRLLGGLDKARNIIDLCEAHKFENVVELGAGDGTILDQLSKAGFAESYTALEISESAVEVIRGRIIEGLRETILFDGYSVPCENGAYDLAILSHVVEHVEHPRLLLQEAARIAGTVFVEVPLELHLRTSRDFRWTDTGHINIYNPLTIRHLLQSTGFKAVKERVSNPSYAVHRFQLGKWRGSVQFAIRSLALRLMPFLATQLFTYHWSALCHSSRCAGGNSGGDAGRPAAR